MKIIWTALAAVSFLLGISICANQSYSAMTGVVIDTRKSYVVESRHFTHIVFRVVGLDKRRIPPRYLREVNRNLSPQLKRQGCAMLKSTSREFKYLKHPTGRIELVIVDHFGRVMLTQNIFWTRCR